MKNENGSFSKAVRRVGIAIVAAGIVAAPAVNANPKPKVVLGPDGSKMLLVSPAALPQLARQSGEAMLLHETGDGRTILYVEQNRGAQLALLDVSDPADMRSLGAVQVNAAGAFDFIAAAGDHAETVRFRDGRGEAWLDLRKFKTPVMRTGPAPKVQSAMFSVDTEGNVVALRASAPEANAHAVAEPANLVVDLSNVREQLTNDSTGTTFVLTDDGLHVIRRPAVEREYEAHQAQLSN